jgi:hypothetical protein
LDGCYFTAALLLLYCCFTAALLLNEDCCSTAERRRLSSSRVILVLTKRFENLYHLLSINLTKQIVITISLSITCRRERFSQ